MPATLDEVKQLVQDAFEGADVDGLKEEHHRVLGIIQWPGFGDLDAKARNRMITEKVRNKLGLRGVNVGILYPLAPGETL